LACGEGFHKYVFIEKNAERCSDLRTLKEDFPQIADRIEVHQADANEEIRRICKQDWRQDRAVLFLDPYGTQVPWKTIEIIAGTRAIDLWVLFPIGAVVRMLPRDGEVPDSWRLVLDDLLGRRDWQNEFYRRTSPPLFPEVGLVERVSVEVIREYFLRRLATRFAGVASRPAELRNSKNSLLYLFCFAVGNERGAPNALKIANYILDMGK
jgi:three-Cys-motif partner protein